MNSTATTSPMDLALEDLDTQKQPNYSATARKYGVNRTTLSKRHWGKTTSKAVAISKHCQRLTIQQEEALITQINELTNRGIPPTSQIVRNMAEEMIVDKVGKNWVATFVRRHKKRLTSLYLRTINNQRKKAEYEPLFESFYDLVSRFEQ